jgi:hypothetical protein
LPPIGIFGKAAAELVGIIIRPDYQGRRFGPLLVRRFVNMHRTERLLAYTRNPALLRVLEAVSGRHEVLAHADPEAAAAQIAQASVGPDGNLYHIGRYAPRGLYGDEDPAGRAYHGRPLMDQCQLLTDPNNALAVSVNLRKP